MTKTLFIFLIFYGLHLPAIKDTLNQLNQKGQKHGIWIIYLDENINPTDSANSFFFAYELFDNGEKLFEFKNFRKKIKVKEKTELVLLSKKGSPQLLNITIKWYTLKTGSLSREEKYVNGYPTFFKGYNKKSRTIFRRTDTSNYYVENIDFTKKYNGTPGTHYYEFIVSEYDIRKYWFRKENGHWGYHKITE